MAGAFVGGVIWEFITLMLREKICFPHWKRASIFNVFPGVIQKSYRCLWDCRWDSLVFHVAPFRCKVVGLRGVFEGDVGV